MVNKVGPALGCASSAAVGVSSRNLGPTLFAIPVDVNLWLGVYNLDKQ